MANTFTAYAVLFFIFITIFLFIKKKSDGLLVIFGAFLIFLISIIFLYNFIFNENLSSLELHNNISNWGSFGAYFGGILAPLLTFITLIILIKQVNETKKTNELQINYMETSRKIELLIQKIEYISNEANKKINAIHPPDEETIKLSIENNLELKGKNIFYESSINDYNQKISTIFFSNKHSCSFEWRTIIAYLEEYQIKHTNKNNVEPGIYIKIEIHNIAVLINKIIPLCCELLNLDKASNQFIKFILFNFYNIIPLLYKNKEIKFNTNKMFYQLIAIHTNNENLIKDSTLKKIFAEELSKCLKQNISEKDLFNIKFILKNSTFFVNIKNEKYIRKNAIWSKLKI